MIGTYEYNYGKGKRDFFVKEGSAVSKGAAPMGSGCHIHSSHSVWQVLMAKRI